MSVVDELIIRMRTIGAGTAAAEIGSTEKSVSRLSSSARAAAGAAGLAGLAFGLKDVTEAAVKFQDQQAQLAGALRNTGQYSRENVTHITNFADTLATHGGFDPATTIAGIQRLITAHDSVNQALHDQMLVTDIARRSGLSYATVLRAVTIVEQGRTTGLARLGIVIQPVKTAEDALTASHVKATLAMKEQAKAQDAQATKLQTMQLLWHRFGGAVQDYNKTSAGAVSNFRGAVDVLAQRLGTALLPLITTLAHTLTGFANTIGVVVEWFQRNHAAAEALKIVLIALAVLWGGQELIRFLGWMRDTWIVTKAFTVASWALTAAQIAFAAATGDSTAALALMGAAMIALDAIAIVAAIAAIVAGLYLLITHFDDVKRGAVVAWHFIESSASAAFGWLKGAFVDVRNTLVAVWRTVAHILVWPFLQIPHVVSGVFDTVKHIVTGVVHWVEGAFAAVGQAIAGAFKTALNFVIGLVDEAIKGVNHLIDLIPNPGDWFGASIPHIPLIPKLAIGTPMVLRSGVFEVGERGPEKVVLPAGAAVLPYGSTWAGHGGGQALDNTVIFKVGEREFARAWQRSVATVKATS